METTIVVRGYIGIMEKKMETTIMGDIGIIRYMLGRYWDNGEENGNYYNIYNILMDPKKYAGSEILRNTSAICKRKPKGPWDFHRL